MFQELLRTVTICSDMRSFFQSYSNPASSMVRRFGTQPGVQTQRPTRKVWQQLDSIQFGFFLLKIIDSRALNLALHVAFGTLEIQGHPQV